MLPEHAAEHGPGLAEGLGAEEHPGQVDQQVGEQTERDEGERARPVAVEPRTQHALGREIQAVQSAPDHEGPAGAMPEAAEQHRRHQRRIRAALAVTIAAERNVEIVAQPRRQRDVPAPPEIGEADRRVRKAEVVRHREAQAHRRADRRRRIAGEVAEDLAAERERRDPGVERAWNLVRVIDFFRDLGRGNCRPARPS